VVQHAARALGERVRRHRETRQLSARHSAALVLAAFGMCACGRTAERPPDIVLLTIDTLRADHLGLYGYSRPTSPNLDRWFANELVFENAYATETATSPSVASILTGLLPQHHRVRIFYQLLPADVITVSDRLRSAGYQTAAVVSNVVLTNEAIGLAAHFEHYDDYVDERESSREHIWERRAARTTDAALAWLGTQRDASRPLFLWLHYIDPHGPYSPPAGEPVHFSHEGRTPVVPGRMQEYQITRGTEDALVYVDLYDEEIAYCDREVGRLLDGLAPKIDLDRTALVFAADHGEAMIEHEWWFSHQYNVYEPLARVPFAIRMPSGLWGRKSGRIRGTVSLVDLTPTLLALAGIPEPPGLDGHSLFDGVPGRALIEATGFDGRYHYRSLVRGNDKWILRLARDSGEILHRWRLRLDSDPGEQSPLEWHAEDERSAAELVELAASDPDPGGYPREYARGAHLNGPKIRPHLSPDEVEKLRALGYVH
jgi:arylsulfatase A-like enzyme